MATTAELLVEAEAAYHKLMTGQSVAEFRDSNGELVRYTAANKNALAAYIRSLKELIANDGDEVSQAPMRPFFL